MNKLITLLALLPGLASSQPDLFAITASSNNTISLAKINRTSGFVTPFGNLTGITGLFGGVNSAINCANSDFVFGAFYNSQYMTVVVDKITGNIKNTLGYAVSGINYNPSDNNYYGLSGLYGNDFISINANTGLKTTISTNTLASLFITYETGSTLDAVNGRYITILKQGSTYRIASISCQNGTYTISPVLPYSNFDLYPSSLAYSNSLNKCYCVMPTPTGPCFGELVIGTASVNTISTQTAIITNMLTGTDACGGVSIDEQSGIYTIIAMGRKVVNISIATGAIISNPSLSIQDTYFIQYANTCSTPTDIIENTIYSSDNNSIYYNLYGQIIEPTPGILMIERRGNYTRKVIIE